MLVSRVLNGDRAAIANVIERFAFLVRSGGAVEDNLLLLAAIAGTNESEELLVQATSLPDERTRSTAAFYLAQINEPLHLNRISELLTSPTKTVSNLAAFSIGWFGGNHHAQYLVWRFGLELCAQEPISSIFEMLGTDVGSFEEVCEGGKIYLIGPSGAGKSTLGKPIAASLGLPYYDTDVEFVAATGIDIVPFFERFGERAFRSIESAILSEVSFRSGKAIVATGSGTPILEENRRIMRQTGQCLYLSYTPMALKARHQGLRDAGTPNSTTHLLAEAGERSLELLLDYRNAYYSASADVVVNMSRLTKDRAITVVQRRISKMLSA